MLSIETAAKAIKTYYHDPIVNLLNKEADPFIAKIHKDTDHVFGTNKIVRAVQLGLNGGFGAGTETGALPAPGEDIYENLESTTKNMYGVLQISDKSLKSLKGNKANAFANLVRRAIDSMMETAKWHLARQVSGSSKGIIAICKAGSGASNVIGVESARLLMPGIMIDILTSAGGQVATKRRIKDVRRNDNEIVIDGTAVSVSAGMIITVQGSYGLELTGLEDIFDTDAEKLYGNERESNSWLNPHIEECGAIDTAILHKVISQQEDTYAVNLDFIRAGNDAYAAYMKLLENKTRLVNTVKLEGGATSLKFAERYIMRDKFMVPDTMAFLDPDKFYLDQICEWDWVPGPVSGIFTQVAGTATYTATIAKYADMVCVIPGGMAMLTGVLAPVT